MRIFSAPRSSSPSSFFDSRPRTPRISIVIPTRNEARNLEVILTTLPPVHEVIIVDGHSVDGTLDTAHRVLPSAITLTQTRRGKGNALSCGFERATGDIIVMFDADGSADAREIPRFVDSLTAGADFAKGSRFRAGGGSEDITRLRTAGNAVLSGIANILLRARFTDLCYGYNAFWRDILPILDLPAAGEPAPHLMNWGDGFEIETLLNCRVARAGIVVEEVPSIELNRIHGVSNLNAVSDGLRVLRTILVETRRRYQPPAVIAEVEPGSALAA
ncbi:glycosyltransferase family 2 protein [Cryobacterium sp. SO2]|uniref:glycosyltransferase family 2 protein n=1 Tax=Cryobacterium sp. SO2 TaxID=1897060 RepID=UPI00223E3BC0|nr:glycosyltransferase family 2 protein [Cryobacterium sp. SO2]WEO76154.1 glycosyltransferase family 2 protein [Cryobacterium sp. SO2]